MMADKADLWDASGGSLLKAAYHRITGGDPVRDMARKDQRFNMLRDMPEFRALVPATQQRLDLPLNLNLPGF